MSSSRIVDIMQRISRGSSFDDLRAAYPMMTRTLFEKLGGVFPAKSITVNDDHVQLITGADLKTENPDYSLLDREVLLGTLMGDGNVAQAGARTHTFSFGHSWEQMGYVKLKYELLKNFVSRVYLAQPSEDGLRDYSFNVYLRTMPFSGQLYREFYTAVVEGKEHPQKDLLKEFVFERLTPRSLAFWAMDDGKRYGKGFSITIAKQPFYSFKVFTELVHSVSDRYGYHCYPREEKTSYEMTFDQAGCRDFLVDAAQFLWPDFYYKFGVPPDDLGQAYRGQEWFETWQRVKGAIRHPLLLSSSLAGYRQSTDGLFRERFEKALSAQIFVRGFPFHDRSEEALLRSWRILKNCKCKETNRTLIAPMYANLFPSSFMPHRYRVRVGKKMSPYDLFHDRTKFEKILRHQISSGSNIENTNIRNALGFYGSSVAGQFNPCFARYFISKFGTSRVLDPCSGWGGRLAAAAVSGIDYYGIEPQTETFASLQRMVSWLKDKTKSSFTLVNGVAEDPISYSGVFDLAITSPPYFDQERYSEESTQSCVRYLEYGAWKASFFKPLLVNVFDHLSPQGIFVLNVANVGKYALVTDAVMLSKEAGFILDDIYKLCSYNYSSEFGALSETVLILRRS